jgi:NADH dehydrogenase/putative oxidoreductase
MKGVILRDSRSRIVARLWLNAAERIAGAFAAGMDLAVRLWLAQAFLVSGLIKVGNWDNALYLAANEYPVSWLDPATAAYVGAAIELLCPIFLAAGLFTRAAAFPMLVLSLVIQFSYRELDTNLYWAALFGWFVVFGPGPLSLDRRLAAGLRTGALPFAAAAIRFADALRRRGGPIYLTALRLWLAVALVGVESPSFLPSVAMGWTAAAAAPAIALGLVTPAVCLLLILTQVGVSMAGGAANPDALWLLALLGASGAGPWSLDHLFDRKLKMRLMPGGNRSGLEAWPHVVIVGAGFGGLACAIKMRFLPVRITLIDRRNYHLFQPLLYQIATASLSPGDIATPVRSVFRDDPNVTVLRGTVDAVDATSGEVSTDGKAIRYDYLVLATGATHSYFGKDHWAPFAPGLKRVEDATEIRSRVLDAFERAEATNSAEERAQLLTFLIVGGGPTGVELSGALAELARHGLEKEFRHFDPATARIILVQSAPRILPAFPERLSEIAKRSLEGLGVEVRLNSRVEMIDREGVRVSGVRIEAGTVLWAAGVMASPAAGWLNAEADSAGRVKVNPDLSVGGFPNVFAVGDTAAANAWDGNPVPGLAPAAKQGGEYVASVIRARLLDKPAPAPFRYRHKGSLATIGRKSAVADFGRVQLSGAVAWWLWGLVHVYFLVGLRNRLSVMFDWFWAYLTYGVGIRLITGEDMAPNYATDAALIRKAS